MTSVDMGDQPAVSRQHARAAEPSPAERLPDQNRLAAYHAGMARLVQAVQELSFARDLPSVMSVVRRAARELTGADGATFVLREGESCYYAEENAIAPLWKGKRFPMEVCISGWAMLHKQTVVLEDIFADPRIRAEWYRPTFVKSLLITPIRTQDPIGAIGNYWGSKHLPTPEEVELLEALANTAAVALQNVQLYGELEQRVQERTAQLQYANRELEAYSYAVSHDLGAPLRHIRGYAQLLREDCYDQLPPEGRNYLQTIEKSANHMRQLLDDLLRLSKVSQGELIRQPLDLSTLVREILTRLATENTNRSVQTNIGAGLEVMADLGLVRILLENLLSNAWKYTSKTDSAIIEFGKANSTNGEAAFFVRDNGAGFDLARAEKLFQPFRRFHTQEEFGGTGIGLATAQRVVHRHGGRIWAESAPGAGATFFFTLPKL